jgi:Tfp pilus assembly protein PilN
VGLWFWFWIWVGIALISLVIYALILADLVVKAKKLQAPGQRLQRIAADLQAKMNEVVEIEELTPALEQTAEEVLNRQKARSTANRKRKEERERRLVNRLKDIDFDESRLL